MHDDVELFLTASATQNACTDGTGWWWSFREYVTYNTLLGGGESASSYSHTCVSPFHVSCRASHTHPADAKLDAELEADILASMLEAERHKYVCRTTHEEAICWPCNVGRGRDAMLFPPGERVLVVPGPQDREAQVKKAP